MDVYDLHISVLCTVYSVHRSGADMHAATSIEWPVY